MMMMMTMPRIEDKKHFVMQLCQLIGFLLPIPFLFSIRLCNRNGIWTARDEGGYLGSDYSIK